MYLLDIDHSCCLIVHVIKQVGKKINIEILYKSHWLNVLDLEVLEDTISNLIFVSIICKKGFLKVMKNNFNPHTLRIDKYIRSGLYCKFYTLGQISFCVKYNCIGTFCI